MGTYEFWAKKKLVLVSSLITFKEGVPFDYNAQVHGRKMKMDTNYFNYNLRVVCFEKLFHEFLYLFSVFVSN